MFIITCFPYSSLGITSWNSGNNTAGGDEEINSNDDQSESMDDGDGELFDDAYEGETYDDVVGSWEQGVVESDNSVVYAEQLTINQAITKCRCLVKMVGKSSILSMFFAHYKEKLKIKSSMMIDCRSRWNSTFRLIRTVLLHKPIINRLYAEKYGLNLTKSQRSR